MATIREVASHCGVSAATVSHVLNGRTGRVSSDTRARVLAAVRALQYRPPAVESATNSTRTRNIALVSGEMSSDPVSRDNYFSRVLDGVLEAAASRGYSLTIFVEKMWSSDGSAIRQSYDGRCDGVILMAPEADNCLAESLAERGTIVTVVGTMIDSQWVSKVDVDNESGAYRLTQHLFDQGHKRISYLGAHRKVVSSRERLVGFERAMRDAGLAAEKQVLLCADSSRGAASRRLANLSSSSSSDESADGGSDWATDLTDDLIVGWGAELVDCLLSSPNPLPTALVCWNDELGRSVVDALQVCGLQVPRDISVVAFDDCGPSTARFPHITIMRQPLKLIGKRAADLTIDRSENPAHPVETVRFAMELVERESASKPSPRLVEKPTRPMTPSFLGERHPVVPILSNGGSH